MQFVLCIRSLNGETQRLNVSPDMTFSDMRRQLEESLPAFSQITFFQGEGELVNAPLNKICDFGLTPAAFCVGDMQLAELL